MAQRLISLPGTKGVLGAFRARNMPEAIVKGMGNAIIVNRVNALLGNPLGAVGLSFTLPIAGIQITPFTLLNYFLLNGFQLKLDINAAIGAILAVFAGANPHGANLASVQFKPGPPGMELSGV